MKKFRKIFVFFIFLLTIFVVPILSSYGQDGIIECTNDLDGDRYYTPINCNWRNKISALGSEKKECDEINAAGELTKGADVVYNPIIVKGKIPLGKNIRPGAIDIPGDGIDQDCDGKDADLIGDIEVKDLNIKNIFNKTIGLLTMVVSSVCVIVVIWGGVMYATAGGNDEKTSKARKAVIGAIIGIIIALSARFIIALVISQLT